MLLIIAISAAATGFDVVIGDASFRFFDLGFHLAKSPRYGDTK